MEACQIAQNVSNCLSVMQIKGRYHRTICLEHKLCLDSLSHSVQSLCFLPTGQKSFYQDKTVEGKELYANELVLCDSIFLGRFYTRLIFPEIETIVDHNKDCNNYNLVII